MESNNKPGTAKVGAISKAQKAFLKLQKRGPFWGFKDPFCCKKHTKVKGDLWSIQKLSNEVKIETFEQSHSVEKFERRDLVGFLSSILLQIIKN